MANKVGRLNRPSRVSQNRAAVRDFERYATTVAAFFRLAMIRIMLGDLLQIPRRESKLPGWALSGTNIMVDALVIASRKVPLFQAAGGTGDAPISPGLLNDTARTRHELTYPAFRSCRRRGPSPAPRKSASVKLLGDLRMVRIFAKELVELYSDV